MTRIIAGRAGGRRLKVPETATRPTSDRVRESLFASLASVVDLAGARVLDLFAGSGALGLEALSRGAQQVVLVEQSPAAARVIADNIRAVALPGATVRRASVQSYLTGGAQQFDLVVLDPPYELTTGAVEDILAALTSGWLADGAVVVVERSATSEPPRWPDGFEDAWSRRFGGTHVQRAVWYRHRKA